MTATDRFFSDIFDRADATDIGNNWTTTGALQIVNQMLRQSGASSAATATATIPVETAAPGCGPNYEVGITVAADTDTTTRSQTILLRLSGDVATGDGYGVTLTWLTNTLTLKIRKLTGGTWATLTSEAVTTEAAVDNSSFDSVFQRLGGRIYDKDGLVFIEAVFEDEEKPRLSWTDQVSPLWKAAGTTGLYVEDNDAGVTGHVFTGGFTLASLALGSDEIIPTVPLYTFGQMRAKVKERCLRDSSSSMSDTVFGDYLNEALKELSATVASAPWWEETYQFQVAVNQTEVMMPAKFYQVDDSAYETGNRRPIPIIRDRDYRSTGLRQSLTVVGSVLGFRRVGVSPMGGIVLQPYPVPGAQETFQITAWRRPATMVNDSDIPDLPEELQPGLIWAAVSAYTMLDSDRAHLVASDNRKKEWISQAIRMKNLFNNSGAPQPVRHAFRLADYSRIFRRFA